MRTKSKSHQTAQSAGKREWPSRDRFYFCIWLVGKVAWVFSTNHKAQLGITKAIPIRILILGSVVLRFKRVTFVCRTFYYFEFITPWKLREGKIEPHFNWNFSCSDIDIVARFLYVTPWCFIFAFSPARTNLYGSLPILIWAHFDWVSHKSQVTTAGQNKRKNWPISIEFRKTKKKTSYNSWSEQKKLSWKTRFIYCLSLLLFLQKRVQSIASHLARVRAREILTFPS